MRAEKIRREQEKEHLHGRFGVGLAGLSEEEALAYAVLVSEEAAQKEQARLFDEAQKKAHATPPPESEFWSGASTVTAMSPPRSVAAGSSSSAPTPRLKTEDELENDIEEAIRLSLLESSGTNSHDSPFLHDGHYITPPSTSGSYGVPFVVKEKKSRRTSPSHSQTSSNSSPKRREKGKGKVRDELEMDDLDYALQLSLAEEESRKAAEFEGGKGKGKEKETGYRY